MLKALVSAGIAASALVGLQRASAQTVAKPPCVTGPWSVLFDADSETVTRAAATILDHVAAAYRDCPTPRVILESHTDSAESDMDSMARSYEQARNVSSYLAARGVAGKVISTMAYGETVPLVKTPNGVPEQRNRRIIISFAQFDEW